MCLVVNSMKVDVLIFVLRRMDGFFLDCTSTDDCPYLLIEYWLILELRMNLIDNYEAGLNMELKVVSHFLHCEKGSETQPKTYLTS